MSADVAIRVDASIMIGSGHVMRCLTLADQIRALGGSVQFLCRHLTDFLRSHIEAAGHRLTILPARAGGADGDLAHSHWLGISQEQDAQDCRAALLGRPCWLVVDHYGLDARWEIQMAAQVANILVIDDLADRPHHCQAILDQNLRSDGDHAYEGKLPAKARRLMGPRFALLRPEFRATSHRRRPGAPRLNLFFGSTDPLGMTLTALKALQGLEIVADVVVGADNPGREAIAALCRTMPQATLHVQPRDFAALLGSADLALGAGGSTSWERCCLGLPTLIVSVAANQRPGTEALAKAGAAIDLGQAGLVSSRQITDAVTLLLSDPGKLAEMRAAAKALVDGRGAERVALHMMREHVSLRPATREDMDLAGCWRNHPEVRGRSLDTSPLTSDGHRMWWEAALASPHRLMLIARSAAADVGVLRFDFASPVEALVSIYLDPNMSGLGLGSSVLRAGKAWITHNHPEIRQLCATI